jgi:hypothetical protein
MLICRRIAINNFFHFKFINIVLIITMELQLRAIKNTIYQNVKKKISGIFMSNSILKLIFEKNLYSAMIIMKYNSKDQGIVPY